MFGAFIVSFWATRFIRKSSIILVIPHINLHLHHFSWGLIALTFAYGALLYCKKESTRHIMAIVGGTMVGIVYDEFDMWIHIKENAPSHNGLYLGLVCFTLMIAVRYFAEKFWKPK